MVVNQFDMVLLLMVKVQIIPIALAITRLLTHTFNKRPTLFINTRSQAMQSILFLVLRARPRPRQPRTPTIQTTQLRLSRSKYRQFQDTQLWSMARLSVTRLSLFGLLTLAKIRLLLMLQMTKVLQLSLSMMTTMEPKLAKQLL